MCIREVVLSFPYSHQWWITVHTCPLCVYNWSLTPSVSIGQSHRSPFDFSDNETSDCNEDCRQLSNNHPQPHFHSASHLSPPASSPVPPSAILGHISKDFKGWMVGGLHMYNHHNEKNQPWAITKTTPSVVANKAFIRQCSDLDTIHLNFFMPKYPRVCSVVVYTLMENTQVPL